MEKKEEQASRSPERKTVKKQLITTWESVPLVMSMKTASDIMGITQDTLKKRAQRGVFPAAKVGCHWKVSKTKLKDYIESL